MVSAVFHPPFEGPAEPANAQKATAGVARQAHAANDDMVPASTSLKPAPANPMKPSFNWSELMLKTLPPAFGLGLLVAIWGVVATVTKGDIPTPWATLQQTISVFSDPFYQKGPNDQGVGWNVLSSLKRVGIGFGMAALVGIRLVS